MQTLADRRHTYTLDVRGRRVGEWESARRRRRRRRRQRERRRGRGRRTWSRRTGDEGCVRVVLPSYQPSETDIEAESQVSAFANILVRKGLCTSLHSHPHLCVCMGVQVRAAESFANILIRVRLAALCPDAWNMFSYLQTVLVLYRARIIHRRAAAQYPSLTHSRW